MSAIAIILFLFLLLFEAAYIRVARGLHIGVPATEPGTSRRFTPVGSGWAVVIAAFTAMIAAPSLAPVVLWGLALAVVSFTDDIRGLSAPLRLTVQAAVVLCALAPVAASAGTAAYVLLAVCSVGYINASNFMDGVNGMLAGCGAATLASIAMALPETSGMRVLCVMLAVAVAAMAVFNFRVRALIFSGDVGSISLGFFVAMALAALIVTTGQVSAVVFVAVFVTDTFLTFVRRIIDREPLMRPHRTHIYQLLVYRGGYSGPAVSAAYAVAQALVSAGWFFTPADGRNLYAAAVSVALVAVYAALRHRFRTLPELTR